MFRLDAGSICLRCMLSITGILLLYVCNLWRFGNILHSFIPHFALHSAEKIRIHFPQITL